MFGGEQPGVEGYKHKETLGCCVVVPAVVVQVNFTELVDGAVRVSQELGCRLSQVLL